MAKLKLAGIALKRSKALKKTPQLARQGEKLWCIAQTKPLFHLLNVIFTYDDASMG